MLKTKTKLILLLVLIFTVLGLFACNSDNGDKGKSSFYFEETDIVLGLNEEMVLPLHIEDQSKLGKVSWKSSDMRTVRVMRGTITGMASGNADVTATLDGKSITCHIEVNNYEYKTEQDLELDKGGTYNISSELKVNGKSVDCEKEFSVVDENVLSVSKTGVLNGLKVGETEVNVKLAYGKWSKEYSFNVKVSIGFLDVSFENTPLYLATGTVLKDGEKGSATVTLNVINKNTGSSWEDLTNVVWEVTDDSVASIEKISDTKATVTAKNKGEADILAKFYYQDEELTYSAKVNCYIPTYKTEDLFIDESDEDNQNLTLKVKVPEEVDVKNIVSINVNSTELSVLSYNDSENTVLIQKGLVSLGVTEAIIKCGKTDYRSYLVFASKVITNKQDFIDFAGDYENNVQIGKTYVLSSDIDMEGTDVSALYGYTGESVIAFNATFDGRGHAIKNAKFINGLFTNLGNSAVIRNLAVIDCEFLADYEGNFNGGFIANDNGGQIENCYVKGELKSSVQGAVLMTNWPNGKVNNCVVIVNDGFEVDGTYAVIGHPDYSMGTGSNIFVVSTDRTELAKAGVSGQVFATVGELNQADLSVLLSSGFWKVLNDNLYFGNIKID